MVCQCWPDWAIFTLVCESTPGHDCRTLAGLAVCLYWLAWLPHTAQHSLTTLLTSHQPTGPQLHVITRARESSSWEFVVTAVWDSSLRFVFWQTFTDVVYGWAASEILIFTWMWLCLDDKLIVWMYMFLVFNSCLKSANSDHRDIDMWCDDIRKLHKAK